MVKFPYMISMFSNPFTIKAACRKLLKPSEKFVKYSQKRGD